MKVTLYDNGGQTADRYTAVLHDYPESQAGTFAALAMDERPFHPQGFCQHTSAMPGPHLGRTIALDALPADCQRALRLFGYS